MLSLRTKAISFRTIKQLEQQIFENQQIYYSVEKCLAVPLVAVNILEYLEN